RSAQCSIMARTISPPEGLLIVIISALRRARWRSVISMAETFPARFKPLATACIWGTCRDRVSLAKRLVSSTVRARRRPEGCLPSTRRPVSRPIWLQGSLPADADGSGSTRLLLLGGKDPVPTGWRGLELKVCDPPAVEIVNGCQVTYCRQPPVIKQPQRCRPILPAVGGQHRRMLLDELGLLDRL